MKEMKPNGMPKTLSHTKLLEHDFTKGCVEGVHNVNM
jgi:hypothetical protein